MVRWQGAFLGLIALAAPASRGGDGAEAEARAARAFSRLQSDPEAVRALGTALEEAGLPRLSEVALDLLARDAKSPQAVRDEARAALVRRAVAGAELAEELLLAHGEGSGLPAPLALRLARAHLEAALDSSPVDAARSFEPIAAAPGSLEPASAEPQPFDRELAAALGAPRDEATPPAKPEATAPEPGAEARRELDRARADAAEAAGADPVGSHEVAALAALAEGDAPAAEKEWLAVVRQKVDSRDAVAVARRDRAFLQLARLAYQSGDDGHAAALYERVGRGAPEWLDALFESSWAHFRSGRDEKALGNLLTLHAPFFDNRFFPESWVVEALAFYENCRYPEARRALAELERRYGPVHEGLSATAVALQTPQQAFEFLAGGPVQIAGLPPAAREEVGRLGAAPDLRAALRATLELGREIDSLDGRSFRGTALGARLAESGRQARLSLLVWTGRRFAGRIASERDQLRELLGQGLRLAYEIAGREKELATSNDSGLATAPTRRNPELDDDEMLWSFQGEYWRDELGSYRYELGQRCRRPRAKPSTARSPAPNPPAMAGETAGR